MACWSERKRWAGALAVLFTSAAFPGACAAPPPSDPVRTGSAAARLKPLAGEIPAASVHRRVYVSVYSSIYLGLEVEHLMAELAATVSVRNVSEEEPIILTHARYYDSAGEPIRDYVNVPSVLAPMASVEFLVKRNDVVGGPGANFVIEWAGPAEMDDPIVEAVMIGQSGNAGFSFTSVGRTVRRPARKPSSP